MYKNEKVYPHSVKNIESGLVVYGLRHCNCFQILAIIYPEREYLKNYITGFLTSANRFVDRVEGAKIAFERKQIFEEKNELYSEDIY